MLLLHLLLVIALAALGGAALRVSARFGSVGLERLVTCAVLLATAAVLEELAVGLVGLGGSPVALAGAAALTWLAARAWLPAPEVGVLDDLVAWLRPLTPMARVGLGALAGGALGLAAIVLRRPEPGFDGIIYHIPEVVGFVQSGHPGAVLTSLYGLPVGNYPLTNEVLLAWLTGISHGLSALTLWTPVAALLMIAAGWLGLRRLGAAPAVRAVALAALLACPLLVLALPEPSTDLTSLVWLVCAAALATGVPGRPIMLVPTVLALGLSIGTKSTPAVYGVIVLAWALWSARGRIAAVRWPLVLAVLAAIAVGGPWYVRNLIEHGSPFWPIVAASWGDPVPPLIRLASPTMLGSLRATLFDHVSFYLSLTSGSAALLVGGFVLGLLARRRRTVLAGAAVGLGALAWANAPVTGRPEVAFLTYATATSVRYLLAVIAAGALALALVATDGARWARLAALATLLGSLVWSLDTDLTNRFYLPYDSWLVVGAAVGAVVVAAGHLLPRAFPAAVARLKRERRHPRAVGALPAAGALLARERRRARAVAVAAAAVCAAALAAGSSGYLVRHSYVGSELDSTVAGILLHQPGFATDGRPVAFAPYLLGPLAGDTLKHRIVLIGQHEPCAQILARAQRDWIALILVHPRPVPGHPGLLYPPQETAQSCLARLHPVFENASFRVYGPTHG